MTALLLGTGLVGESDLNVKLIVRFCDVHKIRLYSLSYKLLQEHQRQLSHLRGKVMITDPVK